MGKISSSDVIFATLFYLGRRVLTIRNSGFTQMADVIAAVRNQAADTTGLASLRVRNSSQGWAVVRPIMLRG